MPPHPTPPEKIPGSGSASAKLRQLPIILVSQHLEISEGGFKVDYKGQCAHAFNRCTPSRSTTELFTASDILYISQVGEGRGGVEGGGGGGGGRGGRRGKEGKRKRPGKGEWREGEEEEGVGKERWLIWKLVLSAKWSPLRTKPNWL